MQQMTHKYRPFLRHVMTGVGEPLAAQVKVTVSPSTTFSSLGRLVIIGRPIHTQLTSFTHHTHMYGLL